MNFALAVAISLSFVHPVHIPRANEAPPSAINPIQDTGVNKDTTVKPAVWTEVKADPILTVLVSPTPAKWVLIDDTAAALRPGSDGKTAYFAAQAAGKYRVIVVGGDGEPTRIQITVGDSPAPAPPAPTPPAPTPPVPTPPAPPVDPFVAKLQAAYNLDTRAANLKATDLADLVELYRQGALLAADTSVATTGDLKARVSAAAQKLVVAGLTDLRKAIGTEVAAVLPVDVPLTTELRTTAAAEFTKISTALKQLK